MIANPAIAIGQNTIPKPARELSRFETLWLTAHLNGDRNWLSRFSGGKHNVVPPGSGRLIEERAEAVTAATATRLQANEMKVRISGTVSLLTNDPAQNRSFHFLDTFNKIGGKWRVIASSISPSPVSETKGPNQIERELSELEKRRVLGDVGADFSVLDRMLGPDFVGVTVNGTVQDRQEWIHARELKGIKSVVTSDMLVRVLADDLAIVIGVDTTTGPGKQVKPSRVRFTNTWAKRTGVWQCVAAHLSRIA